jgi:hypothetical protein
MATTVRKLPALENWLKAGLADGVLTMAQAVADEAGRPNIPRRVVQNAAPKGKVLAKVIFSAPATWLEFGVKPHDIKPKSKKALKLPKGFAEAVHHPGARPQPFINPTVVAVVSRSDQLISAGVKLGWRGSNKKAK